MELDKIREEIDVLDNKMKELFLARMELSRKVIEAKKETGGAVYVPQRESVIIENRSKGVEDELISEYQMFLKQLMGISRTYQYSKIAREAQEIEGVSKEQKELSIYFFEKAGESKLAVVFDALALAGLLVERVDTREITAEGTCYQVSLSGDFSTDLALGALLQIYRELEQVELIFS